MLVVGQGPPVSGGIPSFVTALTGDAWLRERADVTFLNTTTQVAKRPGALTSSNLRDAFEHARAIERAARDVDVVHLNLAAAPTLPLARALALCRAARRGGAAALLHAHTGRMHRAAESASYRALLRGVARQSDALVVVSKSAEEVARPLVPGVVRIENGIDAARYRTGPKDGRPLIAFVGTITPRKGLIDLRDALVRVRARGLGFAVAIVGDDRQEGPGVAAQVQAAYASAGLDDAEFTGALSHDAVKELLGRADVFCLPSHWEGFPLSMLEAMASACAIVGSRVGDVPEMLGEGSAGMLVDAHDVAGLEEALRRLCEDAAERERLGAAARARVEGEYAWQRTVEQLYDLDVSLAGRRAHSM